MKCDRCAIGFGIITIPTRKRSLIGNRPITPINHVMAGVIDSDYRGEIKVQLINLKKEVIKWDNFDVIVNHGDRIAQLIIEKISLGPIIEVEELDSTARGEGGFGSTGR